MVETKNENSRTMALCMCGDRGIGIWGRRLEGSDGLLWFLWSGG